MNNNPNFIMLMNLMAIRKDLSPYEERLYHQLLVTATLKARLDELICQSAVEDAKNGQRIDQTSGGIASPSPEAEEYRSDDSSASI